MLSAELVWLTPAFISAAPWAIRGNILNQKNQDDDIDKDLVGLARFGYDFGENFGIESSYTIMPNFDFDVLQDLDATQLDISLVLKIPANRIVALYGQGGLAHWDTKFHDAGMDDKDKASGIVYGFGIRIQPLTHLMITAGVSYSNFDTQWFNTDYDISVRAINSDLYFHF